LASPNLRFQNGTLSFRTEQRIVIQNGAQRSEETSEAVDGVNLFLVLDSGRDFVIQNAAQRSEESQRNEET